MAPRNRGRLRRSPSRARGGGRRLGQHFLHDQHVLARLAESAGLAPGDTVVEIGAGRGELTRHLARHVGDTGRVLAIELDPILLIDLGVLAADEPQIVPQAADVLELDLTALARDHATRRPVKVVGNLPYYITTPILERLLAHRDAWGTATLTVQDEVARRITATPGTKACGSISVFVHYHCEPAYAFRIAPGSFAPPPSVHSAVVHLIRRERPAVAVADEGCFFATVRAAFGQRRKTLRNALRPLPWGPSVDTIEAALADSGVDAGRRGETLTIDEFGAVADALQRARRTTTPPS